MGLMSFEIPIIFLILALFELRSGRRSSKLVLLKNQKNIRKWPEKEAEVTGLEDLDYIPVMQLSLKRLKIRPKYQYIKENTDCCLPLSNLG